MKLLFAIFILSGSVISGNFLTNSDFEHNQDDKWVAPESARKLNNPASGEKSSIKRGKNLYKSYCVVCHGETGHGDGPGSKALDPKPADHTSKAVQSQTDGELFWKISEGRGNMVGWQHVLKEHDRWDLVNYVRTLAK